MIARLPLPPEALSADGHRFYALLNDAEDVSAVVVGVSYLDACLASLLLKSFRKGSTAEQLLDSRSGPLGSFSSRASLAYALGLISKPIFRDLQVLAQLRNEVAHHHFALDFSAPNILLHVNRLAYAADLRDSGTGRPIFEAEIFANPRNRFTLSAMMISTQLLFAALSAKRPATEA
ncbi:MAG: hypothetical protein KIT35_12420 [Piscinibacter sp.]|uniref:MltR family transcriptional regulator n=1 Tax=Piscinibacter TaxID=1114981 RepID=UPI000FDE409C|nr:MULTISPECIES: MltR family transcriptional regulator [Piscinibacter]MCW5664634.1 hypothetical protein [Piscinibacter sp.]